MDVLGSSLVVLCFADEHGGEAAEGGEDGSSHPGGVLPLGGVEDVDFHGGGREGDHFFFQSVVEV